MLKGLNRLEKRLIALRLPFMQIHLKGKERQWALRGNVINVENNVNTCVDALPRVFDDAFVVHLKLMRRMHYTGHYIYDKVRPKKVYKALEYLINTPLYKKYNVALRDTWQNCEEGTNKFRSQINFRSQIKSYT